MGWTVCSTVRTMIMHSNNCSIAPRLYARYCVGTKPIFMWCKSLTFIYTCGSEKHWVVQLHVLCKRLPCVPPKFAFLHRWDRQNKQTLHEPSWEGVKYVRPNMMDRVAVQPEAKKLFWNSRRQKGYWLRCLRRGFWAKLVCLSADAVNIKIEVRSRTHGLKDSQHGTMILLKRHLVRPYNSKNDHLLIMHQSER